VSAHAEIQELLGVYALDACDPETAAEVEAHLEECLRCAVEVAQHHEVAGMLANSGGSSPARLWDGIADRLGGTTEASWDRLALRLESPAPDGDDAGERVPAAAPPPPSEQPAGPGRIVPLPGDRRRRWAVVGSGLVAAAAAVVALVMGVQVHHLRGQVSALESDPQMSAAVRAAQADPATRRIPLAATSASGQVTTPATIVLTSSGTGFVMNDANDGLPPLPAGRTYQLWGVVDGRTVSLGLLGARPEVVPFSVAGAATPRAFAITAEVSGGVVHSTNAPVAVAAVRSA
jgi:anti-sigma factor RsiW